MFNLASCLHREAWCFSKGTIKTIFSWIEHEEMHMRKESKITGGKFLNSMDLGHSFVAQDLERPKEKDCCSAAIM